MKVIIDECDEIEEAFDSINTFLKILN